MAMTTTPPSTAAWILLLSTALALATTTTTEAFQTPLRAIRTRALPRRSAATLDSPTSSNINNDVPQEDSSNEEDGDKMNWFKEWYPVVPVEYLNPEMPHRFQLLGLDLVVWNDGPVENGVFGSKKKRPKNAKRLEGTWRVFVDECPHRKVPLSEGRVEDDGSLLCSYHAFRFDGEGELVDVPQVTEEKVEQIRKNPKSRCNAFPAQVINGVLWVWPETGDDARLESMLRQPNVFQLPDDVEESRVWNGPYNFRELPYSADYFFENVVDGAHVQVSHHNIVGSRYEVARGSVSKQDAKLSKDGFRVTSEMGNATGFTEFHAPCLVTTGSKLDDQGSLQVLELYASPSRPGFCNHVGRMVIVKPKSGKMPALLRQFTLPMPKWLNHVLGQLFLNQDGVFLHYQERYLAKTGKYISHKDSDANDAVKEFLPIDTDRGVVNFRNWLRKMGGGFIPYRNGRSLPEVSDEVCFDQYKSHTSKCQNCLTALANLRKGRLAAFAVSAALAVLRPARQNLVNLLAVGLTAGIGLGLNKLIGLFYRYEFKHSLND